MVDVFVRPPFYDVLPTTYSYNYVQTITRTSIIIIISYELLMYITKTYLSFYFIPSCRSTRIISTFIYTAIVTFCTGMHILWRHHLTTIKVLVVVA